MLYASSPMYVTKAGTWSEVSFEFQNASSPMCITEGGNWREVSSESMNAQASGRNQGDAGRR